MVYPDTSFLYSLYLTDVNSVQATTLVNKWKPLLLWTPFHRHELRNALRLAVFRKSILASRLKKAFQDIEADKRRGVLKDISIAWDDVFKQAEHLGARYTATLGNRGMDILHVATALALGADTFLTFDRRQHVLAKKAGLKLKP